MYQYEEVSNEEGKDFSKEINAIYMIVSTKSSFHIEQLFYLIGKKYLENHPKNIIFKKLLKYIDY